MAFGLGIVNEATYVLIDHYVFNAAPFSIIFTLCGPLFQLPYLYTHFWKNYSIWCGYEDWSYNFMMGYWLHCRGTLVQSSASSIQKSISLKQCSMIYFKMWTLVQLTVLASLLAIFLYPWLSTFAFVLPPLTFLGWPNVFTSVSSKVRIQTLAIATESSIDIITTTITF